MTQLSMQARGDGSDRWLSLVVLAGTALFTTLLYVAVLAAS
ncbi:MAG TPA: hypothetical protein VJQ52_07620 [Steroidobacteraceae bacterium]|nr:hypothetical protein [Steroidobacteraceae bacterium]